MDKFDLEIEQVERELKKLIAHLHYLKTLQEYSRMKKENSKRKEK